MSFFYSTGAGAVDFAALAIVCGLAFWLGPARARVLAASMVGVFLADRALILTGSLPAQMALGSAAEFIAMCAVLHFAGGRIGKAMALLFASKMLLYPPTVLDVMSWDSMAAWATVACYVQFVLVLMGVTWDGVYRMVGGGGLHRSSDAGANHSLAKRVPSP